MQLIAPSLPATAVAALATNNGLWKTIKKKEEKERVTLTKQNHSHIHHSTVRNKNVADFLWRELGSMSTKAVNYFFESLLDSWVIRLFLWDNIVESMEIVRCLPGRARNGLLTGPSITYWDYYYVFPLTGLLRVSSWGFPPCRPLSGVSSAIIITSARQRLGNWFGNINSQHHTFFPSPGSAS